MSAPRFSDDSDEVIEKLAAIVNNVSMTTSKLSKVLSRARSSRPLVQPRFRDDIRLFEILFLWSEITVHLY